MTTRDQGITLPLARPFLDYTSGAYKVTNTSNDYTVPAAWSYGPAAAGPINLTAPTTSGPQSFRFSSQNANAAFAAAGADINSAPGIGTGGNASGNFVLKDTAGNGSAWNTSHYVMGTFHLWVDGKLRLRWKNSAPTADADGFVVGSSFSGSVVYDPPNLAASASTTTTIGVAGCVLGDMVDGLSFSLDQQGILFSAYVSANNVVTVILFNRTAGAIDLGSGTLRVSVAAGA